MQFAYNNFICQATRSSCFLVSLEFRNTAFLERSRFTNCRNRPNIWMTIKSPFYILFVDIIDNGSRHQSHAYQARSYLYAKYAAAHTLSPQGTFYDVTICNKILTQFTGRSTASLKQRTKLINLISDDGCDCFISWHYSVYAAEQHRQLLEVGSFKH